MSAKSLALPVVMAGGNGTRLWPLSRSLFPKQYQNLHPSGGSLFSAALRLAARIGDGRAEVVTNFEHRFMVREQMHALDAELKTNLLEQSRIWTEPVGRNTCAVAALAAHCAHNSDQVLLLMPADHYIADEDKAVQILQQGVDIAAHANKLVVFGVMPTEPVTEYGYIEMGQPQGGFCDVKSFVEKPDADTARSYCESGGYLWNSGIFAVRADLLYAEICKLHPVLWKAVGDAHAGSRKTAEYQQLPKALWSKVPSASFDQAIVQRTEAPIAAVPFDVGWSDLGSYSALRQAKLATQNTALTAGGKTANANASANATVGRVVATQSEGNYLHAAKDRMLAVLGLRDTVVVDTADAVLVAPLDRIHELRTLMDEVGKDNSEVLHRHRQDYRPWGHFRVLQPEDAEAEGQRFQCKLLSVRPGASLSRQSHEHRSEHWVVVQGVATVEIDGEVHRLQTGESTFIPRRAIHRLSNNGDEMLDIVEVQIGDNLSEEDIKRYSDNYGRAERQEPAN